MYDEKELPSQAISLLLEFDSFHPEKKQNYHGIKKTNATIATLTDHVSDSDFNLLTTSMIRINDAPRFTVRTSVLFLTGRGILL